MNDREFTEQFDALYEKNSALNPKEQLREILRALLFPTPVEKPAEKPKDTK